MKFSAEAFKVVSVNSFTEGADLLTLEGVDVPAISYRCFVGKVKPGDRVLVNTTAVEMGLGTGGYHFIIANLDSPLVHKEGEGHIMKIRYSPFQIAIPTVEETKEYAENESLHISCPVIVTSLHSQIAPVAIMINHFFKGSKTAVIINDSAALPVSFSVTLKKLKEKNLIDFTVSCGNSFGGTFEAVNLYSALVFSSNVKKADFIIVSAGPGLPGTTTMLGNGAINAVESLNAVYTLRMIPFFSLRMSCADSRERHRGISHHAETVLRLTHAKVKIVVPKIKALDKNLKDKIKTQVKNLFTFPQLEIEQINAEGLIEVLLLHQELLKTMGRSMKEDPLFFAAAAAPVFVLKNGNANG